MFGLIERLTGNYDLSKIKDFPDLKKRHLKQKIRKINNKDERIKIWQALIWLSHEGVREYLDKIKGIEYLGRTNGIDCMNYTIGDATPKELVQGILEHNGNPEAGDIIIYGHSLNYPSHIGVYQEDGTIKSKWGDNGPIMKHKWNQILPDYGKYAFFSKFKKTHA